MSPDFGLARNIVQKQKGEASPDFGGIVGVTKRDKVYSDFNGYLGDVKKFVSFSGLFDDPAGTLASIFQSTFDKAKQEAIASTGGALISDPTVQQALTEKAKESVVQQLASQISSGASAATDFVTKHKTLVIGGTIAGTLLVGYLLFGRKK